MRVFLIAYRRRRIDGGCGIYRDISMIEQYHHETVYPPIIPREDWDRRSYVLLRICLYSVLDRIVQILYNHYAIFDPKYEDISRL